jgi:hypothetical protein
MKRILLAIFGLTLASSAALTGCSSSGGGDTATPTASPSASPTESPK